MLRLEVLQSAFWWIDSISDIILQWTSSIISSRFEYKHSVQFLIKSSMNNHYESYIYGVRWKIYEIYYPHSCSFCNRSLTAYIYLKHI